jgi:hypothetical protein
MVEDDGAMVYDSPNNAKKAADFLNSKKIAASFDGKYVYLESVVTEAFKHIIHVDTPTQVVSKPVAAQIMALAKKGIRSKEIGLEMGFTGNAKLAADTFQKVKSRIYFELDKRESVVTEGAGKEAMGIAALTATRGDAVQAFIDKHNLDGVKLFKSIKSANLQGKMNFVSALVGHDGNPNQRLTIKLHQKNESVNEEEIRWSAVENAIINFLKMNTKILDKRVKDKDTDGVKGGLQSIIDGLTNAQRSLKLKK